MAIQATGMGASGLDVNSLVSQLVAAERAPLDQRIRTRETAITTKLSAFSTLKGALSNVKAALQALKSADALAGRTANLTDSSAFRVSFGSGSVTGNYAIEVLSLASTHKMSSALFSSATNEPGNGNLTITQGAESFSFSVGSGTTLAQLVETINTHPDNTGVTATLMTTSDGVRLLLSSTEGGSGNAITLTGTGSLDTFATGFSVNSTGTDAVVKIDGVTVTSATNTLTNVIDGVTLTLTSAKPGTVINFGVQADTAGAEDRLRKFVTEYNNYVSTSRRLRAFDASSNAAGPLIADSLVRNIEMALRRELTARTNSASPDFDSVLAMGFSIGNDARLSINDARFKSAVSERIEDVVKVFTASDGLVERLDALLETQLASDGLIQSRTESLNSSKRRLDQDKLAVENRMSAVEKRYRKQFVALDQLLTQMQGMSSSIAKLST
jgi:flagellar hook-associated protein 2